MQRLQGLEASMDVRMDDMSLLSSVKPNLSSQNLESSWDRPRRCPEEEPHQSSDLISLNSLIHGLGDNDVPQAVLSKMHK